MELLIGCGHDRRKLIRLPNQGDSWHSLVTLDHNPDVSPMVVADLEKIDLPFPDSTFDEIHAYQVLEHTGKQGDAAFFFRQFDEFARILKVGGMFFAACPSYKSQWAWGDPSHTRVLTAGTISFLDRERYNEGSSRTDFRHLFISNWEIVAVEEGDENLIFVLKLRSK